MSAQRRGCTTNRGPPAIPSVEPQAAAHPSGGAGADGFCAPADAHALQRTPQQAPPPCPESTCCRGVRWAGPDESLDSSSARGRPDSAGDGSARLRLPERRNPPPPPGFALLVRLRPPDATESDSASGRMPRRRDTKCGETGVRSAGAADMVAAAAAATAVAVAVAVARVSEGANRKQRIPQRRPLPRRPPFFWPSQSSPSAGRARQAAAARNAPSHSLSAVQSAPDRGGGGPSCISIQPSTAGGLSPQNPPVRRRLSVAAMRLRRDDSSPSRRFVSVAAIRLRRVAAIRSPSDGHGRPRTHTEAMLAGGTKPPPSRCPAEWFVRGPLLAGFAADRCPPTSSPSPANQRTQTERSPCVHFARPVVRSSSSLLCRCCPPSSPLPLAVENYPFWALPDWNEGRKKRNVQKKRMEKKEKIKKKTPPSPDPSSRLRAADSHSTVIRPSPFLPSSPPSSSPSSSPSPPSYPLRPSHRSLPLPRPHLPEIPTLLLRLLPQPVPASRIEQSQPGPLSSRILLCVQPRRRRHRREKKGKQKGRGEA